MGVREQSRMTRYALHGVERLFVVHLALNRMRTDVVEADNTVARVAVQLRRRNLILGKAMLQRVESDMGEPHGVVVALGHVLVKPLSRYLLDDESQEHVVHV